MPAAVVSRSTIPQDPGAIQAEADIETGERWRPHARVFPGLSRNFGSADGVCYRRQAVTLCSALTGRSRRKRHAVRVCIIANASPGTWVEHYIRAFRATCQTLVVGAAAKGKTGSDSVVDVTVDFSEPVDLPALLGDRWPPDLLVAIADPGQRPLYPGVVQCDCPTAFITATSWQSYGDFREALRYDFVFTAQRDWAPLFRATGSQRVFWLPLACAPEAHFPVALRTRYDFAFAGALEGPAFTERRRFLAALKEEFSVVERTKATGANYCKVYGRGRLAFNHSTVRDVNARVFEVMAMGRPLVTNAEALENGLGELFDDGKEVILYEDADALLRLGRAWLKDKAGRLALAARGREKVLTMHTYRNRVRELLYTVQTYAPNPDSMGGPAMKTERFAGPALEDYLPMAPGNVVDMGLSVSTSRFALRRLAVARLVGLSDDDVARRKRSFAYDTMLDWPGGAFRDADTVLLSPESLHAPLDECLAIAHEILEAGGSLVLRMSREKQEAIAPDGDETALESWLQERGFHLRLTGPLLPNGDRILLARKWTRSVADVLTGIYDRLHLPDDEASALLAGVPEGW